MRSGTLSPAVNINKFKILIIILILIYYYISCVLDLEKPVE